MTFEIKDYYPLAGQVVQGDHAELEMLPGEHKQLMTGQFAYLIMSGDGIIKSNSLKTEMKPRYVPLHITDPKNMIDMVESLTTRFFLNAETGINITRSYQDIIERKNHYDDLAESHHYKQPAAALLVGATVERLHRLALHIHSTGDMDTHFEDSPLPPMKEVEFLYNQILSDEDIVGKVQRSNGSYDIDHEFHTLLSDNIRQFDKGENTATLEQTSHSHAYKIAAAMNMIDIVSQECMELTKQLPEPRKKNAQEHLRDYTRLALKAAGIPSSQEDAYDACRIEFKAARNQLKADYNSAKNNNENMTIPDTMTLGIQLIDDMVRIRIPREKTVEKFLETARALHPYAKSEIDPHHVTMQGEQQALPLEL